MINYFTEDKIILYDDVKRLCLQYIENPIYNLDWRHIKNIKIRKMWIGNIYVNMKKCPFLL